jgi:hypothetical protein
MESLNALYLQMLELGLSQIKHALWARDFEFAEAQVVLLHNIPSLISESYIEGHRYFWEAERPHYLAWLSKSGSAEAKAKTATYYESIWAEMQPLMVELFRPAAAATNGQ